MADHDGVEELDQNADEQDELDQGRDEMSGNDDQDESEDSEQDDSSDEVVITIGGEAPPHDEVEKEAAPQWVKDLRKRERELARENRELKAAQAAKADPVVELGPEPTLEDCDFDSDVYKQKLKTYLEQQRAVESKQAEQRQAQESAQKAWQDRVTQYNAAKVALKVPDFDDAEATVGEHLDGTQIGIIVSGADNPEKVIYALGKNPAKLKELASIKDPAKYTFAAAKLEAQLKVTSRKKPPAPEKQLRGSAAAVGVNDPKLARLEAAAEKSGDRSEVIRYQKQLKAKANA